MSTSSHIDPPSHTSNSQSHSFIVPALRSSNSQNFQLSPDRARYSRPSSGVARGSLMSPPITGDVPLKPYVFLGGSCDPTTWRRDIAIPKLEKYKIPYYNPQVEQWDPSFIALEAQAKDECDVLLFVIDSSTRAIASMLEAVEYILSQRNVVLVILDIQPGTVIDGIEVDERQRKDLNRARAFLCDIAARHQKYCDVFDSVENAIAHICLSHRSMTPRTHSGSFVSPSKISLSGSLPTSNPSAPSSTPQNPHSNTVQSVAPH